MAARLDFPEELLALQQPGSLVSTVGLPTIHGALGFDLPLSSANVREITELNDAVKSSTAIPEVTKNNMAAFVAKVHTSYGLTHGDMQGHPAAAEAPQMAIVMAQLGAIANTLNRVEAQVNRVEAQVNRVEAQVNRVEAQVDRVEAQVNRVEAKVDRVEAKVDRLEQKFDISARNRAMHSAGLALAVIPVQVGELPAEFLECPLRVCKDVEALRLPVVDAVAAIYGLAFPPRTSKKVKARAIWEYIGGSRIRVDD